MNDDIKRRSFLQWHITPECRNSCKHCYITSDDKIKGCLPLDSLKKIVEMFVEFCNKYNLRKRLLLTGGDPILSPNFWLLLEYIRDNYFDIELNIAGNPELLNQDVIKQMEEYNIRCYQISIDGMEDTHDYLRYKGSFKESVSKIQLLSKSKILPVSLSTVSTLNIDEIPDVVSFLFEKGLNQWDFARFVPTPENAKIQLIKPERYRDFLYQMKKLYEDLGLSLQQVGRKDPLWNIINEPKIELNPEKCFMGGCGLGTGCFDVLHDGTVLACRRHLNSVIGKLPEDTFESIFFNSKHLNMLRDVEKIRKCNKCKLLWYCRGCRSVAYGATGDFFAPDPQCWL